MRCQLTCVWCAQNNTFAATAFSSYGAFWMGFGMFNILLKVRCTHPLGACLVLLRTGTTSPFLLSILQTCTAYICQEPACIPFSGVARSD